MKATDMEKALLDEPDTDEEYIARLRYEAGMYRSLYETATANERERCIAVCESWIGTFQKFDPKRIDARNYAVDAIEDIIAVIREGTDPRAALDKDPGE